MDLTSEKPIKTPEYLSRSARQWFESVVHDYELSDHHVRLLTLACEAWDRCQQAREAIERDGPFVQGRGGLKAHPAIAVERDSRIAFGRLLKQLNLDGEPHCPGPGRPPENWRSYYGGNLDD